MGRIWDLRGYVILYNDLCGVVVSAVPWCRLINTWSCHSGAAMWSCLLRPPFVSIEFLCSLGHVVGYYLLYLYETFIIEFLELC